MATIEEILGTPLNEMSEEELMAFVRSSRAKRTTIMEDNFSGASAPKRTKKVTPIPDDLLDLMEDL